MGGTENAKDLVWFWSMTFVLFGIVVTAVGIAGTQDVVLREPQLAGYSVAMAFLGLAISLLGVVGLVASRLAGGTRSARAVLGVLHTQDGAW